MIVHQHGVVARLLPKRVGFAIEELESWICKCGVGYIVSVVWALVFFISTYFFQINLGTSKKKKKKKKAGKGGHF